MVFNCVMKTKHNTFNEPLYLINIIDRIICSSVTKLKCYAPQHYR